jgi:hypothetical protein
MTTDKEFIHRVATQPSICESDLFFYLCICKKHNLIRVEHEKCSEMFIWIVRFDQMV